MPWLRIPGGGVAHVKMSAHQQRKLQWCCACGFISTRACDWRGDDGRTCDAPICDAHTWQPEPEKDLCPRHVEAYRAFLRALCIPLG